MKFSLKEKIPDFDLKHLLKSYTVSPLFEKLKVTRFDNHCSGSSGSDRDSGEPP